jgi:hypothetical protein
MRLDFEKKEVSIISFSDGDLGDLGPVLNCDVTLMNEIRSVI